MRYLPDVNVLIALGLAQHSMHDRASAWYRALKPAAELRTCAITELGFVRILSQTALYGLSIAEARKLLRAVTESGPIRFRFLDDDHGVSRLPAWVRTGAQSTDGHLAELARAHDAILVTLDKGIPGAFIIP